MARPKRNMNLHDRTHRPSHLPGSALRALFNEYGLSGNEATDLAAKYLGYTRETIQAILCRQIRMNDYELLRYKLMEWHIEKAVEESRLSAYGPVRADGKRHRREDWEKIKEETRIMKRDYMRRAKYALNPNSRFYRKPE